MNVKIYHTHRLKELTLYRDHITQGDLQIQYSLHQNTSIIFHRIKIYNSAICMETYKTPSSQYNLEKEQKGWRHHAPWFQTILQLIKTLWYQHSKRHTDQCSPETNPCFSGQLIYNKRTRVNNGEKKPSLITDVGKTRKLYAKESNCTTLSHHAQK